MINDGKVFTIASTKGGVGKTVISINLAGAFYLLGLKTLLIDMDVDYGGIALALNVSERKNLYSLYWDYNNGEYKTFNDYVIRYNEGIDVLCAPIDPRHGADIEYDFVSEIIKYSKEKYDVIIIDTTHANTEQKISSIDNSDLTLQIMTNSAMSYRGVKSIFSIIKELDFQNKVKVLLNNSINNGRINYSKSDVSRIIGLNIDYELTRNYYVDDIDKYIFDGVPFILSPTYQRKNKNEVKYYIEIAKDLINSDENVRLNTSKSFISRILGRSNMHKDREHTSRKLRKIAQEVNDVDK